MRVAVAPNAFRGSLTAQEAVDCIVAGLSQSSLCNVECLKMPLADGGDGTLETLLRGLGGEKLAVTVHGPDEFPVQAEAGLLADGKTAVIEMARASGIELLPVSRRNPLMTTTYGTGELILAAWQRGYRRFIIGLGGSATVEGGAGCFQALGARLLDANGQDIPHGAAGLASLSTINVKSLLINRDEIEVIVLSDVTNPLLGPSGATRVFGPQKGADAAMVEVLEQNLTHFAAVIEQALGVDVKPIVGGGSAGGFGAGLVAFLNAKIVPGAEALISMLNYDQQLKNVDLVITGEGKLDGQTSGGKAVSAIAAIAKRGGIPVIALAGKIDAQLSELQAIGIDSAWSIVQGPCSLEEALANAPVWLTQTAREIGNLLAISSRIKPFTRD